MRFLFFILILSPIQSRIAVHPFVHHKNSSFEYRPYFSAIVVNKLDSSVKWYREVFDLQVKNEMKDDAMGYHVVILESPVFSMELLQLRGSLNRKELLKGQPDDIKIQGHYKIGFRIPDMDACLKYLKAIKIEVPQIWKDAKTGKRNFLVTDPDGNLLQFFE